MTGKTRFTLTRLMLFCLLFFLYFKKIACINLAEKKIERFQEPVYLTTYNCQFKEMYLGNTRQRN